jgi:hypothetical protein
LTTTTSRKKEKSPTLRDALSVLTSRPSPTVVGLDVETTSTQPRNGEIRLAQIAVDGRTFVIDLFKVRDARPVFEALADLEIIVAHNAPFEYGWVYAKYGICLDNLRDTYLLARLASRGDMSVECGLGPVVERKLGIILDKEMQTSDWSSPKLTTRQLDYAAMDAHILRPLNERLTQEVFDSDQGKSPRLRTLPSPLWGVCAWKECPSTGTAGSRTRDRSSRSATPWPWRCSTRNGCPNEPLFPNSGSSRGRIA